LLKRNGGPTHRVSSKARSGRHQGIEAAGATDRCVLSERLGHPLPCSDLCGARVY
jgi:hypothetical protein